MKQQKKKVMNFTMNSENYTIFMVDKNTIKEKYNKDLSADASYVFGLTIYSKHEIWLNNEIGFDQLIKTLKHELTHCYIWSFGLGQVLQFSEEMVCEIVSASNNEINRITGLFKHFYEVYKKGEMVK